MKSNAVLKIAAVVGMVMAPVAAQAGTKASDFGRSSTHFGKDRYGSDAGSRGKSSFHNDRGRGQYFGDRGPSGGKGKHWGWGRGHHPGWGKGGPGGKGNHWGWHKSRGC